MKTHKQIMMIFLVLLLYFSANFFYLHPTIANRSIQLFEQTVHHSNLHFEQRNNSSASTLHEEIFNCSTTVHKSSVTEIYSLTFSNSSVTEIEQKLSASATPLKGQILNSSGTQLFEQKINASATQLKEQRLNSSGTPEDEQKLDSDLLDERKIHSSSTSISSFNLLLLNCSKAPLWEKRIDFTHFNSNNFNDTGTNNGCNLAPNWIHFIRWENGPMNFVHMTCILAAFKHQNPRRIFMHGNKNTSYSGKYWKVLTETPGFLNVVEWHHLEPPATIFGQIIGKKWRKRRGSEIERIKIIAKYGGIFLENDCYLVKNINYFRTFEIAMNWDENQYLSNKVIIAHKDARFLTAWLGTYRGTYRENMYYHAGQRPTVEVLHKHPEWLHRVKVVFGTDRKYGANVVNGQWDGWWDMYLIHLSINQQMTYHNLSPQATYPVKFNEVNILKYPIALRDMVNYVYPLKANLTSPEFWMEPKA